MLIIITRLRKEQNIMITQIKRTFLAFLLIFCLINISPVLCIFTSAFVVNDLNSNNADSQGIIYEIHETEKTASVSKANSKTISGTITIPEKVKKSNAEYIVNIIEDYAFINCLNITDISIPESITKIGDGVFRNCTGLKNILIPNSVSSIGNSTFYSCSNLSSVKLSNKLIAINEQTFYKCTSLSSITIPSSVTTIEKEAFKYCKNLNAISFPSGLTTIGSSAFYNCEKITEISIPDSISILGRSAFYNTTWYKNKPNGLIYLGKFIYKYKGTMPLNTSVTLQDGTKRIADEAFSRCKNMVSISIPNSVISIGNASFNGCKGLTSINLPNSITNISENAFDSCTGLTCIIIPTGVNSITKFTFYDCSNLKSITVLNNIKNIDILFFNYCEDLIFKLYDNTYAHTFALKNNIKFELLERSEPTWNITFDQKFANGIIDEQSVSKIKEKQGSDISIKDSKGNILNGNAIVGTGSVISYNGNDYTVLIKGDLNGDGKIDSKDYLLIKRAYLRIYTLNEFQTKVACLKDTSFPTAIDYLKVKRHFLGTYNIFE